MTTVCGAKVGFAEIFLMPQPPRRRRGLRGIKVQADFSPQDETSRHFTQDRFLHGLRRECELAFVGVEVDDYHLSIFDIAS